VCKISTAIKHVTHSEICMLKHWTAAGTVNIGHTDEITHECDNCNMKLVARTIMHSVSSLVKLCSVHIVLCCV
jgi:hypothetical protein